ncbi:MAG: hypothetical protein CMP10_12420 [Zetaproteobacteria bacterium]|nr:hypothetical protein [Pseudobdellovibrionaceae bacterium]
MSVPILHIRHQFGCLATIGKAALSAMKKTDMDFSPAIPSEAVEDTIPPRHRFLIRDFVRHIGGEPEDYTNEVPPHFFPQWCVPTLSKTLQGIPWDLTKILNGGCEMVINQPIPQNEALVVNASLSGFNRKENMIIIEQKIFTGTASAPKSIEITQSSLIPLKVKKKNKGEKKPKEKPKVPLEAKEIGQIQLKGSAGWEFAVLTGDFNPLHWVPMWAKAAGHASPINHGFSTMARSFEVLKNNVWEGSTENLHKFSCRFTRPLKLPAEVGVFVEGNNVYVGNAPGHLAALVGSYEYKSN